MAPIEDTPWGRGKFSYKVLQYMASGRPCVASPVGTNKELLDQAQIGLAAALAWGPALGTFAGGWILNYYGWRPIFILFGSVTLLWLIPWLLVSRPHWRGYAHGSGNNVPVGQVMRNRTVWAMGIGHFCNTYGFYFLLAWLPLFLVKVRHLSILEMTGMMTTAYRRPGFRRACLGLPVGPAGHNRLG